MYVTKAGRDGLWQDLVRFEDEHGGLVAQALPAGRGVPVPDAPEPCPLCADTEWVMIRQHVYCSTCGLCVGEADLDGGDEYEVEGPEAPGQIASDPSEFFASLPFAVGDGELTGGGFVSVGGGLPEEVTMQSGSVHVASGLGAPQDLRWQLSLMLGEPDPPLDRSPAARRVFAEVRQRRLWRVSLPPSRAGPQEPAMRSVAYAYASR